MDMIHYHVGSKNPYAHLFDIKMVITKPSPEGQKLFLPTWIPGSYSIRDFARHIESIKAYTTPDQSEVKIHKLNDHTFECEPVSGELTLEYTVYAFDVSVRGAYLDESRAFINGCCIFLCAKDQERKKSLVTLSTPMCPNAKDWRVATTLPKEE